MGEDVGIEAWEVTAGAFERRMPWHEVRSTGQPVRLGPVTAVVVPHPEARISNDDHGRAWERVAAVLQTVGYAGGGAAGPTKVPPDVGRAY